MEARLERDKRLLFDQLRREIRDEKALEAMQRVPRGLFVPPESRHLAYNDIPVLRGEGQTISQPYIVALMVSALELREGDRVMEIGTGSGYQAAILSQLVPQARVLTLERVPVLAHSASERLSSMGYDNVDVRIAGETLGVSRGRHLRRHHCRRCVPETARGAAEADGRGGTSGDTRRDSKGAGVGQGAQDR